MGFAAGSGAAETGVARSSAYDRTGGTSGPAYVCRPARAREDAWFFSPLASNGSGRSPVERRQAVSRVQSGGDRRFAHVAGFIPGGDDVERCFGLSDALAGRLSV